MLPKELIKEYNKIRQNTDKSLLCHAPFVNINFEQNGNMTACCYNRMNVFGTYPKHGIKEAWMSRGAEFLRERIKENNLDGGCHLCNELLKSKNFSGSKAIHYDQYAHKHLARDELQNLPLGIPLTYYPKVFEFEIDNTCNLECVMCNGYYSSSIRKNRENLPPLVTPYDANFVSQVAEFIPYLTDMKFLGGEPFMIKIYYDIWDKIIELNPNISVHITTNGTVLNKRVRSYLSKMNVGIIISIDSIDPTNYPLIRKNADLEKVLKNIAEFGQITKEKGTFLTLTVCPMVNNWQDMPDLLQYANENEYNIHFNVVWKPFKLSLRSLDQDQIKEVADSLRSFDFETSSPIQKQNVKNYQELINTIEFWISKEFSKLEECYDSSYFSADTDLKDPTGLKDLAGRKKLELNLEALSLIPENAGTRRIIELCLISLVEVSEKLDAQIKEVLNQMKSDLAVVKKEHWDLKEAYLKIWNNCGNVSFIESYFEALNYLSPAVLGETESREFRKKELVLKDAIFNLEDNKIIINDMIEGLIHKKFVEQLEFINAAPVEALKSHIDVSYGQ